MSFTYYSNYQLSKFNQTAVKGLKEPFEILAGPERLPAGLIDKYGNQYLGHKVEGPNPLHITTIVRPDGTIQTLSSPLEIALKQSPDKTTYIPDSRDTALLAALANDGHVTRKGLFRKTEYTLTPPGGTAELAQQAAAAKAAAEARAAANAAAIEAARNASKEGVPVVPVLPYEETSRETPKVPQAQTTEPKIHFNPTYTCQGR